MRLNSIPVHVLAERGNLGLGQALARYLCEDNAGPHLNHVDAARALGMRDRRQIDTLLNQAAVKLGETRGTAGITPATMKRLKQHARANNRRGDNLKPNRTNPLKQGD